MYLNVILGIMLPEDYIYKSQWINKSKVLALGILVFECIPKLLGIKKPPDSGQEVIPMFSPRTNPYCELLSKQVYVFFAYSS